MRITACMNCGGTDLKAIRTPRGSFTGSYYCRECGHSAPAMTFDDEESYLEFRRTRSDRQA